jgi:ATP-binding cassette subfamily B protein
VHRLWRRWGARRAHRFLAPGGSRQAGAPDARWRGLLELLCLLPRVSAPLTVAVCGLVLLDVALALGFTVAAGRLAGAVPAVVQGGGLGTAAGQGALLALGAAGACYLGQRAAGPVREVLGIALGREVERRLEERVMRAVLRPAGIAHLEDPALLDRISQAQGVGTARYRPGVATTALIEALRIWLGGLGFAAVVLGFRWWLGLGLLATWVYAAHVRRRDFLQSSTVVTGQTSALRRAEYLRDLALAPGAAKEVRVYGWVRWLTERFDGAWGEAMRAVWHERRHGGGAVTRVTLLTVAVEGAALAYVGWAGVGGELDLTAVTVLAGAILGLKEVGSPQGAGDYYLAYGAAAIPAVTELEAWTAAGPAGRHDASAQGDTGRAGGRATRLRVLPPGVPATASAGHHGAIGPARAIRFERVTFRYPGAGAATLEELDLAIPAGRSLAIVGANGAGKTTLIKLLCGLYAPQSGRITVDGIALQDVDPAAWRRRVAAIFQDFVQYPLTVRENVGFGAVSHLEEPGAQEALAAAAAQAGALELIEALPRGWDTVLSRQFAGGVELSGGQWQRIALARALFAVRPVRRQDAPTPTDPSPGARVLILDEPTASLDVRAEAALFDRFLALTGGLTTVLVSHRFSTVRRADRICVLEHGRVVEQGTHDELLAVRGRYARLFTLQAARFSDRTTWQAVSGTGVSPNA